MRHKFLMAVIAAMLAIALGYLVGRVTPRRASTITAQDTLHAKSGIASAPSSAGDHSSETRKTFARANLAAMPIGAPLPAPGAPIAAVFDDLAERAQRGDAPAAMRLFFDLNRCRYRSIHKLMLDALAPSALDGSLAVATSATQDADSPARSTSAVSTQLDQLDRTDTLCADLTSEQLDSRGEWLRDAALAGDAQAMVCYAISANDFGPQFLSDAWFDYAQRWRNEAPEFVARAFAAGQSDVLPLLMEAYSDNEMFGQRMWIYDYSALVAPNPQSDYAYTLLFLRAIPARAANAYQSSASDLRKQLTSEQIAQAQAFADANWPRFAAQAGDRRNYVPCRDGLLPDATE